MADPQATIQALLDDLIASDEERGLQVAVYHRGDLVVDAWAGLADAATGTPVTPETLFTVYSVSKGITATALHILAEQGKLAYDDPIAKHWPEFATNGKADILVRHALSHVSGIPQVPPGTTFDDVLDWSGMCERIAALTPLWPAGDNTVLPRPDLWLDPRRPGRARRRPPLRPHRRGGDRPASQSERSLFRRAVVRARPRRHAGRAPGTA